MPFELIVKPTFNHQLRALPPKVVGQIIEKINLLRDDPAPHGSAKKKLHGYKGDVYRLRSGDYRILYTYGDGWVTVLGVDNRADVYKGDHLVAEPTTLDIRTLPDLDRALEAEDQPRIRPRPVATRVAAADDTLPRPIDVALLQQLRIPDLFIPALLACKTATDLCEADVPEAIRSAVFDAVTEPDYGLVLQQPDLLPGSADSLLRYREGDLLGFLLRLSPEQEKFVTWALNATGPTPVKGGPDSGKSTVALYRVRAMLAALRAAGVTRPRILFTTYTNALVISSRQQLEQLLGDDRDCVDVQTADLLAWRTVRAVDGEVEMVKKELKGALKRAKEGAAFTGNALQRRAQEVAIQALDDDYLRDEILGVIQARQLRTLEEYLAAARPGRLIPFNETRRAAVWRVHEALERELARLGRVTWQRLRGRAEEIVRGGGGGERYDGVVVDEAQDLDPSALRMLVGLCRAPNRLFVTADANQSIYGGGFRWADVHARLQFRGRTGVLRTNFRSTREIGEAAQSYLAAGLLDDEPIERDYAHTGGLIPAVRTVESGGQECELLARFMPEAARMFRLGRGSCAVLVPTEEVGGSIAAELTSRGLPATFMAGRDLDLTSREIKVLTLQSAKGLEFPIVALAGFLHATFPRRQPGVSDEAWDEALARARRTLFVGMTRAMRALLVTIPAGGAPPPLTGFDGAYWNRGAPGEGRE